MSSPQTSEIKRIHRGQSPAGEAVVIWLKYKDGSCGLVSPVLKSTTPAGVLSAHGSESHISLVERCSGAERRIFSMAAIVAPFAPRISPSSLGFRASTSLYTRRTISKILMVDSFPHRRPSHSSQRPHSATYRQSSRYLLENSKASASSQMAGGIISPSTPMPLA